MTLARDVEFEDEAFRNAFSTRLKIVPVLPERWVEPPRQSLTKRLIRTLLRLPRPAPVPVYPEGTQAFSFDATEGDVTRRVFIPHGRLELA